MSDTERVLPWQQTWNGKRWTDMPSQGVDHKLLDFALFRRGLIDFVDEEMTLEMTDGSSIIQRRTMNVLSLRGQQALRRKAMREGRPVPKSPWARGRRALPVMEGQVEMVRELGSYGQRHAWLRPFQRLAERCGVAASAVTTWGRGVGMGEERMQALREVLEEVRADLAVHRERAAKVQKMWLEARGPVKLKNGSAKELSRRTGICVSVTAQLHGDTASIRPENLAKIEAALREMLADRASWEMGGGRSGVAA